MGRHPDCARAPRKRWEDGQRAGGLSAAGERAVDWARARRNGKIKTFMNIETANTKLPIYNIRGTSSL